MYSASLSLTQLTQQRHWDYSSSESPTAQRQRLIRAFTKVDTIPEKWDTVRGSFSYSPMERIPTAQEVRDILEPWRTLRWREAAASLWAERYDEGTWLPTYYAPDIEDMDGVQVSSDYIFQEWTTIEEDFDPAFEIHRLPDEFLMMLQCSTLEKSGARFSTSYPN